MWSFVDLFCTLSVDCYGRFDKKAKTHVVKESVAPGWEQVFFSVIDLLAYSFCLSFVFLNSNLVFL